MSAASKASLSLFIGVLLFAAGCHNSAHEGPIGPKAEIKVPLGLPPIPIPANNPPTVDAITLGRRLFYDRRLSNDGSLACSSCHNPRFDFTDGTRLSKGVGAAMGIRNAPTLLNAAYLPFQFWDGRAISLEQQAASPIVDPREMNQTHKASIAKLQSDPVYRSMFAKTFGSRDVTIGRVEKALASFERTLISGNSAFDRYHYGGDMTAMSASAVRGLSIFVNPGRGNCVACHSLSSDSALFTDGKFHNIGEGANDAGQFDDVGRYHETNVATDRGAFKTPTLRNVANTAPYMHDGSLRTLKDVVDFYAGGGNSNPYLDSEIKSIHLSAQDRVDLVEFLKSLTGDLPANVGPPEERSPHP
jgi:cytochrome c peroxidase